MTPKQQRFVEEYLKDLNATRAYIRAGYSPTGADAGAARLLGNVRVAEAIRVKREVVSEQAGLTAVWVLDQLRENVERAMQAEAVRDREGNETGEYVYQGAVANKALELIGKHLGMFVERSEVKTTATVYVVEAPAKFTTPDRWQRQYSHN